MAAKNAPMEAKVVAASGAALIAGFVVSWIVFKAPGLRSMADPLQAALSALITAAVTAAVGWMAKHTPRPGDDPPVPPAGM